MKRGRVPVEELFDRQVATLLKKSYPDGAGMDEKMFLYYVRRLRKVVCDIDIVDAYIPFLIVIPECFVPITKQMALVTLKNKNGYSCLEPALLRNPVDQRAPYLAVHVENGNATRNMSANDSAKRFAEKGRLALTVEEGIALVSHFPEVLVHHFIDLPGSHYKSHSVPSLYLHGDTPELNWSSRHCSYAWWGSASCANRLTPEGAVLAGD